jgi:predicted DNA-binding transcriptional regulator AlpA
MVSKVLRFSDLKARGVVNNRATLSRWIKNYGFPAGFLLGPNSRGWYEEDVADWLSRRSGNSSNHSTAAYLS